jgi:myo-inositol 2-dehydrogenase / D-chiro-inositol 1-dehydrogenase
MKGHSMGFRLGLVGAGRMGRTHLAAIGVSVGGEISVVGVVEPYPTEGLAGIPVFATLDELLAATPIDGALVAVPTDQHVAVVSQVLAAGVPVLCEKPCGLTSAEAAKIATAAEGLPLRVAYWRRFVPDLVRLRERIQGGELGDILAVYCAQWDLAPPSSAFRNSSGGIFADMGVHEFDQIRWLTGQELVSVHAARSRAGVDGDPDCAQIVAELDGGATATISLGRFHPAGDSVKVEVYGTKGTAASWFLHPDGGEAVFHHALRSQAEDFARSVQAGVAGTGAGIADAIAALRAAELAGRN